MNRRTNLATWRHLVLAFATSIALIFVEIGPTW